MQAQAPRVFFLNPLNAAFIKKQTPRPAFGEMTANGLWILLIFFLVALAIFLILAIPAWKTWADLSYQGVSVQGELVDLRFEDRDVSYFYAIFRFPANELIYQNEMKMDWDQYQMLLDNGPGVPVRYVAQNPNVAQLDAPYENFGDFRVGGTLLGGGFLLFLLIAILLHGERRRRNSELVTKGKLVKGVVVAAAGNKPEEDSIPLQMLTLFFSGALFRMRQRRANEFRLKVRYSFVSPVSDREIMRAEVAVRNDLDRRLVPEPGTPVAVLYRSDNHFRLL
jgi:hypothetical protein